MVEGLDVIYSEVVILSPTLGKYARGFAIDSEGYPEFYIAGTPILLKDSRENCRNVNKGEYFLGFNGKSIVSAECKGFSPNNVIMIEIFENKKSKEPMFKLFGVGGSGIKEVEFSNILGDWAAGICHYQKVVDKTREHAALVGLAGLNTKSISVLTNSWSTEDI